MEKIVRAPLENRRAEFHDRIADGLQLLETRFERIDPSDLTDNEFFVSARFETTQAAMRTSVEEKREYPASAVLNVAAGFTLEDVIQSSLIQIVARFTGHHIAVLKLYQNAALLAHLFEMRNATAHGPMKE